MRFHGWIGVDLDGTLALYDGWRGPDHIGDPVPAMVDRVKGWLAQGREVRVVTARALLRSAEAIALDHEAVRRIGDWCELHVGARLAVQFWKDYGMVELWDDRAVQVELNTGRRVGE